MIVEKALSFFTSVDALSDARPEMTGFTSFNEEEHSPSDINRKKTAQLGKKMTTIFEKDTITSGKIVYVTSDNRDTGYSTAGSEKVQQLVEAMQQHTNSNQWNHITQISISRLPAFQNFFNQKTIIIGDFFWEKKKIQVVIDACKANKVRCIVIPLLGEHGVIEHPLCQKYPQWFRQLDI